MNKLEMASETQSEENRPYLGLEPFKGVSRLSFLDDFETAVQDLWRNKSTLDLTAPQLQVDDIVKLYLESYGENAAADDLRIDCFDVMPSETPDIGSIAERFGYEASIAEVSVALPDSPMLGEHSPIEEASRMPLLNLASIDGDKCGRNPRYGDPNLNTFSVHAHWPRSRVEKDGRIVMPFKTTTIDETVQIEGLVSNY
jgi:hypothetical protein